MKNIFIFILVISNWAMASDDFILSEVNVDCSNSALCATKKDRYANLIGEYRSLVHLKDTLKVVASDGGYQYFAYEIKKIDDKNILFIDVKLKPVIFDIDVGFTDRNLQLDPSQLLSVREGDFFEPQKLKDDIKALPNRLETYGYPESSHKLEVKENENQVMVNLVITLGQPRVFKNIKTNSMSPYVDDFLKKKFNNFYNKPFELTKFKLYLDEAQKELFSYGYYLINLDFVPIYKQHRVTLDVKVLNDRLFAFDFRNLKQEHRNTMHNLVKDLFRKYKRPLSESTLKASLQEHYDNKALLNARIDIEMDKFRNKYLEEVSLYRIKVEERTKTILKSVNFLGNVYFDKKHLRSMFEKEAFELASLRYYDEEYLNFFVGFLKTKYIEEGFVQIKVLGPNKTFDADRKISNAEYVIQEGQRTFVRSVSFSGIPHEFEEELHSKMFNKRSVPFNPLKMPEDIKKVATFFQEQGYYFAEVANGNEQSLVQYSRTGADVDINYSVNLGSMVRLNRVIFLGNNKTRKKVLSKKINLERGDIITPSKTREIETAISATGLFNTVSAVPLKHGSTNASTDLIVKVTEREYGLVEFAPGFRTDIGIKFTGTISYLNIGGRNQSVTLRSQVNQRLNYTTLDPARRKSNLQFLEHNTTFTFNQGDIFDTKIDFGAGAAYQVKRFYSFDAKIFRINTTFTRDLTKKLSSSLRYQLENITQENAVQESDNGSFRIGAVTPSLTYDLRSSVINPLRGAFFNISCEFANPYFLSQDTQDLKVNYYKLISRNRFYLPYKNGTLALSMVGGMQENLSTKEIKDDGLPVYVNGEKKTEGYIPNIKVFRLTGTDIVRGYSDTEINRLIDGRDISRARIQDKAYLAVFKIEPRYFINDALMTGVFFDAGRVYVDNVDVNELRTSAGLTFKVITPVGTLDFDYGIKLLRKRNADGSLEDPGRFHVSIGFF